MADNAFADFLRSEKDTRPHWETDQRGMVMPLVKSGYNDAVSYGAPALLGGSAWGVLDDILRGRKVHPDEVAQGATDAAGAAMTGAFAAPKPSGAIGMAGRPKTPLPMDEASRMARARDMGFDVDNPLYVSMLQPINSFEPHGKFMGHKGISGISLSDRPEIASRYLDRFGDADWRGRPFNKNMMKVFIRPGEVMRIDKPLYPASTGAPLPEYYTWPRTLDGVDTAIFPDRITKRGDVAHLPEDSQRPMHVGREYILRDPSRIRSVFAAFDPVKRDSANLLASRGLPVPMPVDDEQRIRQADSQANAFEGRR